MADRYTYVPLIGVFVIVVWGVADGLAHLPGRRLVLAAAAGAAIVACAAATRAQVEHWRDGWALWTHALAVTSNNERAHAAVGAMLGNQGRTEEAIAHFKEALRIDPTFGDARSDLNLIESKEDMKKRGLVSSDLLDAGALTFARPMAKRVTTKKKDQINVLL